MRKLWTAQVHLLTPPGVSGDTKCWTNIVTWADNAEDYAQRISHVLDARCWSIVEIQKCQRAEECRQIIAEHKEQINAARKTPDSCIFGTLHYYPSKPV